MKESIRRFWGWILKVYDNLTAKEVDVAIGDIFLKYPRPDFILFLVASRYLDARNYISRKDDSFKYMNGISFKAHGDRHSPERGCKQFIELIDSFKEKGYDPKSRLVLDKDLNLNNGTHRLALCLLNETYSIKAKVIKRRALIQKTVDWYYNAGLDSIFLKEIYDEYKRIYDELVASGHAFICRVEGDIRMVADDLKSDLSVLTGCSNLSIVHNSSNFIEYSFCIENPCYSIDYKKGQLFSKRAAEIEVILMKRYKDNNLTISVSKNCLT